MSNVDKDLDYMISPQEFYTLLSQKFEKDDPKEEAFRKKNIKVTQNRYCNKKTLKIQTWIPIQDKSRRKQLIP